MRIVAIVGRPNVGKSTLFNRIIKRREAIVQSEPGVTRDRIYADAEWNGKTFTLIDTGGIVPEGKAAFEREIKEQAQLAIDEADVIVFVVDTIDGINPTDEKIAQMLRASHKPIVLVANKCDNEKMDAEAFEFYRFGFDEVFAVSAANGRSTGDFLDAIVENIPEEEVEEDSRLKIAIVGRPNVGKSSISNALLGKDRMIVTDIPGTTRDAIDSVLKYYGKEFTLIDTAGLRKKSSNKDSVETYSVIRTMRAIERCDIAILVLDGVLGLEDQDKKILNQIVDARKGVIIAVNKWDLVEKDTKTADAFTKKIREALPTIDYPPIVYVSAITKQRLTKIIELVEKINERRSSRIRTSQLNDIMLPEMEKTPPPAVSGKDLRINYVSQVGINPPVFAFFCNHPALIPESYKRFLENRMREKFDFEGVPLLLVFKGKKNPYVEDSN